MAGLSVLCTRTGDADVMFEERHMIFSVALVAGIAAGLRWDARNSFHI